MKKDSRARLNANVRIYLIPKDEYEEVNGKPKLSGKYLVYEGKKKDIKPL
jgi:hypothetical protein